MNIHQGKILCSTEPILVPTVSPLERSFNRAVISHCEFAQQALASPNTHGIYVSDDIERVESTGMLFQIPCAPEGLTQKDVERLHHAGVRVMGLTHDGENEYGGGWQSTGRLTVSGMFLIGAMAEQGIMPDLSNMNSATARDALDFIRQEKVPLYPMASHAGCATISAHPRNFSDDVLDRIAVGLGFAGIRLTVHPFENQSLEGFLRQVSYAIYRMGRQCVGVGSDNNLYHPMPAIKAMLEDTKSGRKIASDLCGGNFRSFLKRSLPRA
ncbi:MAG: membrane dipeptidase [Minisyncoccia bacterium]